MTGYFYQGRVDLAGHNTLICILFYYGFGGDLNKLTPKKLSQKFIKFEMFRPFLIKRPAKSLTKQFLINATDLRDWWDSYSIAARSNFFNFTSFNFLSQHNITWQ